MIETVKRNAPRKRGNIMTDKELKKLVAIAKANQLIPDDREDLKAKNSDSLDFTDCAVWNIEAALIAAYELGKVAGSAKK